MRLLQHDDRELIKIKKALRIAMDALDWYGDITHYDELGRAEERSPGTKAAGAVSKIRFILRGVRIDNNG